MGLPGNWVQIPLRVGSNPAQGKLSFKHLLLKYDYLGCALSGFLSYTLYKLKISLYPSWILPCHLLSWLRSCIINLILSWVSSGVIGSPTLSPWKKSFPGGLRPSHVNHLFGGCVASMVVLVVEWWSHPTSYGGTWVQIPLRANFLSNGYSWNMIIWGVHCQGFCHTLSIIEISLYPSWILPCHLLSWLLSCIINLILSWVSSGVIGSPTLSPCKKSFPGGLRPNHMNHLFGGCVASIVVLVVEWWSHPTGYGGTWVQIPLMANFLSNIYSWDIYIYIYIYKIATFKQALWLVKPSSL